MGGGDEHFVAVLHRYGTGISIDLAKWATAHGMPVASELLRSAYEWLAARDVSWAQELCIYMFIWMAKLGAAYGVRTGIHVGVDVLVNWLSPGSRKPVILFSLLCGALFTAVVAVFGGLFVKGMFETGQQSSDLEAPMWLVYLTLPLGSGLMCFRFLQVAWWFSRTGQLPHHDVAHVEGMRDGLHPDDVTELPQKLAPEPVGSDLDPGAAIDRRDLCRPGDRVIRAAAGLARWDHVPAADRLDVDGHASFYRAQPYRACVHVHADRCPHGACADSAP